MVGKVIVSRAGNVGVLYMHEPEGIAADDLRHGPRTGGRLNCE